MYEEKKGFWGCVLGVIELIGFFLAITWPLFALFSMLSDKP